MRNYYQHDTFVHNTLAAEKIVPVLTGLFKPNSVIDVGCGTGTWMKIFLNNGVTTVHGIEGALVDKEKLLVQDSLVFIEDLEKTTNIKAKYDLAVCLEVAEHLPESSAENLVLKLMQLSDIIYFSAAIPFQGGQNHLNEQWLGYWINIFKKYDYVSYDFIRPMFWSDPDVEFWYSQNSCVFIKKNIQYPELEKLPSFYNKDIVHPLMFSKKGRFVQQVWNGDMHFKNIFSLMIKKIRNTFK